MYLNYAFWPRAECRRSSSGNTQPISITWVQTPAGMALKFDTTASNDRTYIVSKTSGSVLTRQSRGGNPSTSDHRDQGRGSQDITCTMFSSNCTACLSANDTRKVWASPCVFLSGPTEDNATCQPSKWWAKAAGTYPHVHPCASCTTPASSCAPLPPPPEATCPVQTL